MASRKLQKQITRELRRITESIPADLLKNLMKKEKIAPTLKDLLKKGLKEDITDVQRERFELILASGILDREVEVINPDSEAAIDAYLAAEIALAVKAGRLPAEAPQWSKLKAKGKKYARKQEARLRELFSPEADQGGSEEGTDPERADADSAGSGDARTLHESSEERSGPEEASGASNEGSTGG